MRLKFLCAVVFVVTVAAVARPSWAQWGGGYNAGSTVAESYARGLSDVVRAEGQRNVMNSEASKRYEEARSQYIQNQLQYTEQYFAARRIKQQYYHEEEARKNKKPTPEAAYRSALAMAPKRMTDKELDPLTGKIYWPAVLTLPPYKRDRAELDASFEERAAVGELDAEQHLHVQSTIRQLQANLKSNIREYPPQDYIAARGFSEKLLNEARFAMTAPTTQSTTPPPKPPSPKP